MSFQLLETNATTYRSEPAVIPSNSHVILADDSDATYVTINRLQQVICGFEDLPTLPTGALIKRIEVMHRGYYVTGPTITTPNSVTVFDDNRADTDGITAVYSTPSVIAYWFPINTEKSNLNRTEADQVAGVDPTPGGPDPNFGYRLYTPADVNQATVAVVNYSGGGAGAIRLVEMELNVVYVTLPVLPDVTAPTGTNILDSKPLVQWTETRDVDGGNRTHFQVKVFSSAQWGAGGFNPETSTPVYDSGEIAEESTSLNGSHRTTAMIANGTNYRAYVKYAQTVGAEKHWSPWGYELFTQATPAPNAPTVSNVADNANGRITITVTSNGGPVSTEFYEVDRSYDGGTTWMPLRGPTRITGTSPITVYDYDAPNGVSIMHRARAVHQDTTSGGLGHSANSATDTTIWNDENWWLKHPYDPSLNAKVTLRSQPSATRAARRGVFHPAGRTDVIVVSDTRGPWTGNVVFKTLTEAERDALDALIADSVPLLLQSPAGEPNWVDRWMSFGDFQRERAYDNINSDLMFESTDWTEVEQPIG